MLSCFFQVLLNQLEGSRNFPSLPKALRHYKHFYMHQPDPQGPFAYSTFAVQRFRQDEAAFFRFCEPWSMEVERNNLGISNILEAWSMLHNKSLGSQPTVHQRHGFIATICVWLLVSIIVSLAVYLTL
jgi:hypothetical protein